MFVPENYEIIGFIAFYDDGTIWRSDELAGTDLYQKFTQLPLDGLQVLNTYQRYENRLYESIHGMTTYYATPKGVFSGGVESDATIVRRHLDAFLIAGRQMENVAYMTLLEGAMNVTEF